jgi:hypothetical protein
MGMGFRRKIGNTCVKGGVILRSVKYEEPVFVNFPKPTHGKTVKGVVPHKDESFLSYNLSESSTGLAHIDRDKDETLIPNNREGCVLISAGRILESLTKGTSEIN